MKYKNTIYKAKEGVRCDLNLQTAPYPQAPFCSFRKDKKTNPGESTWVENKPLLWEGWGGALKSQQGIGSSEINRGTVNG